MVLASSTIARAFTTYQLSVLIEEPLPDLLADPHDAALAMASDPLELYDEDVRQRWDALWQQARQHASVSGNAAPLNPMEAVLLSILLEQEKRLAALECQLAAGERGKDR